MEIRHAVSKLAAAIAEMVVVNQFVISKDLPLVSRGRHRVVIVLRVEPVPKGDE